MRISLLDSRLISLSYLKVQSVFNCLTSSGESHGKFYACLFGLYLSGSDRQVTISLWPLLFYILYLMIWYMHLKPAKKYFFVWSWNIFFSMLLDSHALYTSPFLDCQKNTWRASIKWIIPSIDALVVANPPSMLTIRFLSFAVLFDKSNRYSLRLPTKIIIAMPISLYNHRYLHDSSVTNHH